jgi:hypothetical protein
MIGVRAYFPVQFLGGLEETQKMTPLFWETALTDGILQSGIVRTGRGK